MRFLFSVLLTAMVIPFYVGWGIKKADEQINKMQKDAFNTPGADAPIPPPVIMGGSLILGGHLLQARWLGLRMWQMVAGLLLGVMFGMVLYLAGFQQRGKSE